MSRLELKLLLPLFVRLQVSAAQSTGSPQTQTRAESATASIPTDIPNLFLSKNTETAKLSAFVCQDFHFPHDNQILTRAWQFSLTELRRRAFTGDAQAAYEVGCEYEWPSFNGIQKDHAAAAAWFKFAADHNYPAALDSLGWLYVMGFGVKENDKYGFALRRKAAELGYKPSKNPLPNRLSVNGRIYNTLGEIDWRGMSKDYADSHLDSSQRWVATAMALGLAAAILENQSKSTGGQSGVPASDDLDSFHVPKVCMLRTQETIDGPDGSYQVASARQGFGSECENNPDAY